MKTYWRGTRFALPASVALSVLAGCGNAYSQKTAPQRDMSNAERNVRSMEIGTETPKDSKTILAEVNEDFERLRIINTEINQASSSSEPLNYKSLMDNSVEIKKRGNRLKLNLAGLPKAEKEEKRQKETVPSDETQMKSLLSTVNTVMKGFLANPVFSDMGTLDNQLAFKARRDLDYLVELSDVVKKGAEKLIKTVR
jgi:hypothetical protein